MSRLHKCLLVLMVSFFALSVPVAATAGVALFVSSAPPVPENVPPPYGDEGCYMVPGGYYNNLWINPHRVCEYPDAPDGGAWISGYWQCTNYNYDRCRHWGWVPSHWIRPGYHGEYGVLWRHGYAPHGYRGYDHRYDHRYDHGYDRGYHHDDRHDDRHDDHHDDHRHDDHGYKDSWN
jgi:hypothetical protein